MYQVLHLTRKSTLSVGTVEHVDVLRNGLKEDKLSVVITSGGFDPLHVGHIEYLRKAKKMADTHICIVNSDAFLDRKKGYHFMDWIDRMTIINSLWSVDATMPCIDSDDTVCQTLRYLRAEHPDEVMYFVKGGDRKRDEIPEAKVCDELDIRIIDGLGDKVRSSSELVQNIINIGGKK
jgi:D-beta-D-heptose 7-phosphate kinase/D-beta-D-heptose 1-phosphate adenosyltransferase